MNSWSPGVEVHGIDHIALPGADIFMQHLHQAYANEPEMPIEIIVPVSTLDD